MSPVGADPFGAPATISDGGLVNKWRTASEAIERDLDILRRCEADRARCDSPAALRLIAIAGAARHREGLGRLGEINRAINLAIRPVSDMAQYGVPDYWSSPLATLAAGAGDCEDYAIAKYAALRAAGIAASDMRLMIVDDRLAREEHAVLAVRFEGRWRILDNRTLIMVEDTQMRHALPLFALDQAGVRRFDSAGFAVAGLTPEIRPQPQEIPLQIAIAVAIAPSADVPISTATLANDGFEPMLF